MFRQKSFPKNFQEKQNWNKKEMEEKCKNSLKKHLKR